MPVAAFFTRLSEYWYNVSSRSEIPIAGDIEHEDEGVSRAHTFFTEFDFEKPSEYIETKLLGNEISINDIRPWIGKADKAFYLEMSLRASRCSHPDSDKECAICGCDRWNIIRHQTSFFQNFLSKKGNSVQSKSRMAALISEYFVDNGITNYAPTYSSFSREQFHDLYSSLIGGANTQKIAKRMGHGAEQQLAIMIHELGCEIRPANKHTNPMAPDENLDPETLNFVDSADGTIPADIVVLNEENVSLIVLAMIHTSDPGQYGVDKANNARDYYMDILDKHDGVDFWLLLDGVGFSENTRGTITPLLENCTDFVQLSTLFKFGLRLHSLGLCKIEAIKFLDPYDSEDIQILVKKYVPDDVTVVYEVMDPVSGEIMDNTYYSTNYTEINAGRALLYIMPITP